MEWKSLRRRQGQEGVGLRLNRWRLTAAVIQVSCKELGHRQAMGMGQHLGLGQRLLTPPYGLRRIAQAPQRVSSHGKAPHPRRHAMAERLGLLRCGVNEGDALLEVRPGGGVFALEIQGAPERVMGLQAGRRFGLALC
jgi:hypothetical protein